MNQNNTNYQKELEKIIDSIRDGEKSPTLLLHSCCAPCSSYCLIYLRDKFDITAFFYNPNITGAYEYTHRLCELERFVEEINLGKKSEEISEQVADGYRDKKEDDNTVTCVTDNRVKVIGGDFDPDAFLEAVKGLEDVPEGGARCAKCFALRLEETAKMASEKGFDYFTTTLTISPLKNAALINQIGKAMGEKYGVKWLPSDFKKKGGYQESIRLSKEHDLYRQDFCGCEFSKRRDYKAE